MFVQDLPKSRNPTQFMLQPANEWERFNELCKQRLIICVIRFFPFLGNEFLHSFEARFIEALILCAKNTFEMIKNRANPTL